MENIFFQQSLRMIKNNILRLIMSIYGVTGVTLAIYSLVQQGVIRFDRIFLFWFQLTPLVISVLSARWIYEDASKRSLKHPSFWSFGALVAWFIILPIYIVYSKRHPFYVKQQGNTEVSDTTASRGFKKVVGIYLLISAVFSLSLLFIVLVFF